MEPLSFSVIGEPVPKGSTTSQMITRRDGSVVMKGGRPLIVTRDSTGPRGVANEHAIAAAALYARQAAGWPLLRAQPVSVSLRFAMPRLKSHWGTGKNAGQIKPSAPSAPIVAPDLDKLVRRALDAMTAVIYADDSQVTILSAEKRYGDPPGIEVEVCPLEQPLIKAREQLELVA